MSHANSDDDVGRQILDVFIRNRIPASGMLPRNYFFAVRDGDFQRGLNKAVANDWVAIDPRNRYRYQLTATGYAAGQTIEVPARRRPISDQSVLLATRHRWPAIRQPRLPDRRRTN